MAGSRLDELFRRTCKERPKLILSFRWKAIALSIVLAVLAGVYVAGELFNGPTMYGRAIQTPLFPSFDPAKAESIQLSDGHGKDIELRRNGSVWNVVLGQEELPASLAKVHAFLSSVANLERGKLANTNSALDGEFNLDAAHARRVRIKADAGKVVADIWVGKSGSSGFEDYLRKADDNHIYLTRSSMAFYFAETRSYWYDLALLPDDVTGSSIQSVDVSGDIPADASGHRFIHESYRLVRKGAAMAQRWTADGSPMMLNQGRVQTTCNHLASLQGVDFVLDGQTQKNNPLTITVTTDRGSQYVLHAVYDAGKEQYLVTRNHLPYVYLVNTAALIRIVLPLEELVSH